ncbi:hypothetical protein NL108_009850 [Boleophthalmus pectinirostris]|nr:hypothetical protein NL108_009850 [Boleophthalmus pectinirostris]
MQLSSWCVPLLASVLLLSLSAAAPAAHNCTELSQPLPRDQLHQVLGTWILIEAYGSNDLLDFHLKSIGSEWLKINTTAEDGIMRLVQGMRHKGQKEKYCGFFQNSEVLLVNSSALQIEADPDTFFNFLQTSCS